MEESIVLSPSGEESGPIQSPVIGSLSEFNPDDKKPTTGVWVCLAALGVLFFICLLVVLVVAISSSYPKEDFANTVEEIYGGRGDYGGSGHDGRDDASDAARATISGGGGDASDVVKTTGSDSNTPPPLRSRTPFANDSNTPPPLRSRKPITSGERLIEGH
ncbi:uncharacterized protein LOC142785022 [Rhipicephalus microplus]|uniref:uncharacterized protein LOC142785022 n=1 Tax=Rhipicephalus microplus TaxID=6941 RepID=UPI003F6AAB9A